jgi:hypothetical protein
VKILRGAVLLLFFVMRLAAFAQSRNELGLLLGVEIIPDHSTVAPSAPITFGKSSSLQATYAHRAVGGEHAALFFEVPFVASPSHSVSSSVQGTPVSLATLYVTPGLRLAILPDKLPSPWLSVGGGYGLYESSEKLENGVPNPDRFRNTGALQFGGGLDFKTPLHILLPISLRAEVRDFYTLDTPNFITAVREDHQQNVIASGGLVVRW